MTCWVNRFNCKCVFSFSFFLFGEEELAFYPITTHSFIIRLGFCASPCVCVWVSAHARAVDDVSTHLDCLFFFFFFALQCHLMNLN